MQDVNQIALVCRLGKEPELRTLNGGSSVCTLRVAYTQSRKDGNEWKDETGWIDVTVFGTQAESCAKYLSKGRQVAVVGRLDYREWESEGKKNNRTQIIASQVQFIGGEGQGNTNQREPARASASSEPPPF